MLMTGLSFLPIIQSTRLGYLSDAIILFRALMERISILGYLSENEDQISRYMDGKSKTEQKAMSWLKDSGDKIHMTLYGYASKVVHPYLVGMGGSLLSHNNISGSFRLDLGANEKLGFDVDTILGLLIYSIQVIDNILSKLIPNRNITPMGEDEKMLRYFNLQEIQNFLDYLNSSLEMINQDSEIS